MICYIDMICCDLTSTRATYVQRTSYIVASGIKANPGPECGMVFRYRLWMYVWYEGGEELNVER